jgi:DNA-binding beta-propeller fold protein YncE
VRDANRYPTRLASGADGRIYASDSRANAVFVYDAHLNLVAQLGGLDRPLGVAADARGRIYVGSAGRRAIEVYAPDGAKLFDMGAGGIAMPNDLALDRHGNVVVADSASNRVGVYTAEGAWLRDVGAGDPEGLRFPAALACSAGRAGGEELFVADQGHSKVKVYGPDGTFLRAFGGPAPAFSTEYKGRFVRLQSLALDPQGRLHAADSAVARIQILDARTGAWVDDYGAFGTQIGRLNLPLDILVRDSGDVLVANAENHRVELLASPGGRRKEGVKP